MHMGWDVYEKALRLRDSHTALCEFVENLNGQLRQLAVINRQFSVASLHLRLGIRGGSKQTQPTGQLEWAEPRDYIAMMMDSTSHCTAGAPLSRSNRLQISYSGNAGCVGRNLV